MRVSMSAGAIVLIAVSTVMANGSTTSLRSENSHRRLSFDEIAGYEPYTVVTDANAIDLDLGLMKTQLFANDEDDIRKALNIYNNGGHAGQYAEITLTNRALTAAVPDGTIALGTDLQNADVQGTVYGKRSNGDTNIVFLYDISEVQSNYLDCQVGALQELGLERTRRCLAASGTIKIGEAGSYSYNYDVSSQNKNLITLASFSTLASSNMLSCANCPHKTFEKFYKFYGEASFADKWVVSAAQAARAEFGQQTKVADFGGLSFDARANASYYGIVLLTMFNQVIYQMEASIDKCHSNEDGRHEWDLAAAYHAGSLEGTDGNGDGNMFHQLADDLCMETKTCGRSSAGLSGRSYVNRMILDNLRDAKRYFTTRQCDSLRLNKENIETNMQIPLVQGTLIQAYKREFQSDNTIDEAKGAAFAAAIAPLVHECSQSDANIIWGNMRMGSETPSFAEVKSALERNYECLRISCHNVGGVIDPLTSLYYSGAAPCVAGTVPTMPGAPVSSPTFSSTTNSVNNSSGGDSGPQNKAAIIGGSIGGVVGFGLILIIVVIWRTKRGKESRPAEKGNAPVFKAGEESDDKEVL